MTYGIKVNIETQVRSAGFGFWPAVRELSECTVRGRLESDPELQTELTRTDE